jgi:hypothetical protein
MRAILAQILKSNWFAVAVHAGLWLIVYLAATCLAGRAPEFGEADSFSTPPQTPAPIARLEPLLSTAPWTNSFAQTNLINPFFTRHFIPPPAPPPAVPTTRKIELTYQGFYRTGESARQAIVKMGDAFVVTPIGASIATNLFIADATMLHLILTNLAAQTNILTLNTQKVIEIPIP